MVNRYLWKGKRARWSFRKLITSRKVGGVGHILIKDYYVASILAQLRTWFPNSPRTRWQEIEESQTPSNTLYDLLMSSILNTTYTTILSPSMKASLQAWKMLIEIQNTSLWYDDTLYLEECLIKTVRHTTLDL